MRYGTLTPGRTYYWTVQAVDAGYARSAFAAEESFVVTGTPVISKSTTSPFRSTPARSRVPFTAEDPETLRDLLRIEVISLNAVLLPHPAFTLEELLPAGRRSRAETRPGGNRHNHHPRHGWRRSRQRALLHVLHPLKHRTRLRAAATTVDVPANGKQILALNGFDPEGEFRTTKSCDDRITARSKLWGRLQSIDPTRSFSGTTHWSSGLRPGSWPAFGRITLHVIPGHRIQPELRIVRVGFPPTSPDCCRSLAGTTVDVEVSPDLQHWTSLGEHSIPPSEILTLDPPNPAEGSTLFLRAIRKE